MDDLRPLKIPENLKGSALDRDDLSRLQSEDPSLQKSRNQTGVRKTRDGKVSFEEKDRVLQGA